MSDNPVCLIQVSHRFGEVETLRDITLTIGRNEFVALVGPSGCGKTTLLNVVSGYTTPSSGTVERPGRLRTIYQEDGLFPWLTVEKNIGLGLRGDPNTSGGTQSVSHLLTLIGLSAFARHYPHQLSGGMRQLVELARALAGETDLLIMDEPFSALDYLARLRMRHELARLLAERRRTVILVTHDIGEAAQLADRVIVLTERPGRVRCEINIDAPRPRSPTDPTVVNITRQVLTELGLENEGMRGRIPAV